MIPTRGRFVLPSDAMIVAYERIIAKCKDKRESIVDITRGNPRLREAMIGGMLYGEQVARDEGFRGALVWVEQTCCDEINTLRGALKPIDPKLMKGTPGITRGFYRCQFCGYEGRGWKNKGYECPRCGKEYDAILAQDSDQ